MCDEVIINTRKFLFGDFGFDCDSPPWRRAVQYKSPVVMTSDMTNCQIFVDLKEITCQFGLNSSLTVFSLPN